MTMEIQRKIFVQVPSYRDRQLIPTLTDLVANASNPGELRVVVCWQHDTDEALGDFVDAGFLHSGSTRRNGHAVHVLGKDGAIVEVIDIHFLDTKGCGWARNAIQGHYDGERYNLQIDAHHRFIENWDAAMIDMLESLRGKYRKPLLTGYPPSFNPALFPQDRQNHVGQMLVRKFTTVGVVSYRAARMPGWEERTEPMRARFMSGGFVFSDGAFVEEVMNDADHFFSTEEIVMAVRAFSHGYDFFHPHRVLLWHQYNSEARKVWEDHTDERKSSGEIEGSAMDRSILALQRSLLLLGVSSEHEAVDFGRYGLGQDRSIRQFERYAGLSFRHRGIRREASTPTEPDESHYDLPDSEWEDGLICKRAFQVRIGSDRALRSSSGLDSVVVFAYAADGTELVRRSLSADDLKVLLEEDAFEYVDQFDACPSRLPAQYDIQATSQSPELSGAFSIAVGELSNDFVSAYP
ncbi:GlcNAc-transferase family protein [Lysobacter sp. CA196]|uniref:GlcNAc-transferase family protein n=1 Tax=Lysobacter sp. CA196 TaxID=3455606 RepID=UPI003F8D283C